MKPRKPLLATVLILSASIAGFASSPSDESRRIRLQVLRGSASGSLTLLERAYVDTAGILGQHNRCSQFFGGTESVRVLDELMITLREHSSNDAHTSFRMSGTSKFFVNSEGAVLYRIFAEAKLNSGGPFYRAKAFPSAPFVPNVGSFRPNTRPARVLILLHELAHLINGPDGRWLIPDDGNNAQLSRQNTIIIESRCEEQIRAL